MLLKGTGDAAAIGGQVRRARIIGWHQEMARRLKGLVVERGPNDQILSWQPPELPPPLLRPAYNAAEVAQWCAQMIEPAGVVNFYKAALKEERCQSNRQGRGDAIDHELYAYDPGLQMAVVRTRYTLPQPAQNFLDVRGDYFLVGHNELTRVPFRQPLSSEAVHAAIDEHGPDQAAVVRACQSWMWQVPPHRLDGGRRCGDILLISVRGEPDGMRLGTMIHLGSHIIEAAEVRLGRYLIEATGVRQSDRLYGRDLTIRHKCARRRDVMAWGWKQIVLAREAQPWISPGTSRPGEGLCRVHRAQWRTSCGDYQM